MRSEKVQPRAEQPVEQHIAAIQVSVAGMAAAAQDQFAIDSQPGTGSGRLAGMLQLLSRFPARRSPALAQTIARHFEVIGSDPRISGCVRECAVRLVGDWHAYALPGETDAAGRQKAPLH